MADRYHRLVPSGVRITRYANVISVRTGMGQALVGMLLLGGVTSLPEVAVAIVPTPGRALLQSQWTPFRPGPKWKRRSDDGLTSWGAV